MGCLLLRLRCRRNLRRLLQQSCQPAASASAVDLAKRWVWCRWDVCFPVFAAVVTSDVSYNNPVNLRRLHLLLLLRKRWVWCRWDVCFPVFAAVVTSDVSYKGRVNLRVCICCWFCSLTQWFKRRRTRLGCRLNAGFAALLNANRRRRNHSYVRTNPDQRHRDKGFIHISLSSTAN